MPTTSLRSCSDSHGADKRDASNLLDSASQILQAQSALFLLVRSSRSPDLDALHVTTMQVRGWVEAMGDQFHDSVRSGGIPQAGRYGSLVAALGESQRVLEQFVPFRARRGAQAPAVAAHAAIAAAHAHLGVLRPDSDSFLTDILATCCAADVTDIAQRRNN